MNLAQAIQIAFQVLSIAQSSELNKLPAQDVAQYYAIRQYLLRLQRRNPKVVESAGFSSPVPEEFDA